MNDALRDKIIEDIRAAFSEVRRGTITLHEAEVIDRCGSEAEQRAARAGDTEKRWQDIPDADIEALHSALYFLCPESFLYYIPAYMVWSLRHYRTSQSLSSDSVIYALTPNTNKPMDKKKLALFAEFSLAQRRAIRRFLEFMVEHGDGYADDTAAKLALDAYWNERANVA